MANHLLIRKIQPAIGKILGTHHQDGFIEPVTLAHFSHFSDEHVATSEFLKNRTEKKGIHPSALGPLYLLCKGPATAAAAFRGIHEVTSVFVHRNPGGYLTGSVCVNTPTPPV